jgi:hypothetical protein
MSTATPYLRLRASLFETLGLTAAAERFAPAGALVLVYHGLVARQTDPLLERYAIEEAEFVRHLRHFRKRFAPVSIEHLADALLSRAPVDPRWVVITFDDALRTQAQRGAEILADHGLGSAGTCPSL